MASTSTISTAPNMVSLTVGTVVVHLSRVTENIRGALMPSAFDGVTIIIIVLGGLPV